MCDFSCSQQLTNFTPEIHRTIHRVFYIVSSIHDFFVNVVI